jgi:hypothetical protein
MINLLPCLDFILLAGRGDMWNVILAHMTAMTALKRMPQEEFAKIITRAFVAHIEASERSRFERKVLKTLQLAIMPAEQEVSNAFRLLLYTTMFIILLLYLSFII